MILAPVYRTQIPETERLSVSELVEDLQASGTKAESAQSIAGIRELIVAGAKADDVGFQVYTKWYLGTSEDWVDSRGIRFQLRRFRLDHISGNNSGG